MDRSTPIKLIARSYTTDSYGVLQPTKTERTVYANITSVTGAEWFEGGRNGLNPELRAIMFSPDYEGEEVVEYNGVQYSVYRTYQARTDVLELYLERSKGVQGIPDPAPTPTPTPTPEPEATP